ncbi:MAG TPA: S24 family peptidase [Candidatus Saccharimonadales bacterium]|nr:S24 family peptidase [Candidatus Saccharimonadales bacterium]
MDDSETVANSGTRVALHAGFPNAAAERSSKPPLSLDQLLIRHPSSTYLFRVRGDHWLERGIFDGDIALIDRALPPRLGDLLLIWADEGFTLRAYTADYRPHQPWGVVTTVIHDYRGATNEADPVS